MFFQIPGGAGLLFIGVVMLLFLVVTFAVIGGFILVRRSRSPDQQRLERLEDQVQELQRRVDRIDDQ
jgi:UPF0716 family protein affecting phage T7 exclusion